MHSILIAALAACAPVDEAPDAPPTEAAPAAMPSSDVLPPPSFFAGTSTIGFWRGDLRDRSAGTTLDLVLVDVPGSVPFEVYASQGIDPTAGCLGGPGSDCLGLDTPTLVASGTTAPAGDDTFTWTVPGGAAVGDRYLLRAVLDPGGPAPSLTQLRPILVTPDPATTNRFKAITIFDRAPGGGIQATRTERYPANGTALCRYRAESVMSVDAKSTCPDCLFQFYVVYDGWQELTAPGSCLAELGLDVAALGPTPISFGYAWDYYYGPGGGFGNGYGYFTTDLGDLSFYGGTPWEPGIQEDYAYAHPDGWRATRVGDIPLTY